MSDFKVFDDRDDILDRSPAYPEFDGVLFPEDAITQAAELNEAFSIQNNKRKRIADLSAKAGDRAAGADIVTVDLETGAYDLAAGEIYVEGDVRPVAAKSLVGVPIQGDAQIGVRIVETIIDHEDDPNLLGQHPGSASHGEPGAIRSKKVLEWGYRGDGGTGGLFPVYTLRNGYVLDQAPPPNLSGVAQQHSRFIHGAHGNYIDDGLDVTALGDVNNDGSQHFAISEGIGYVKGFAFTRATGSRYVEAEAPDLESVDAEPHTYVANNEGKSVIEVNHAPINGITTVFITKEFTETITRGAVANTTDLLSKTGVTKIISVMQGATDYDVDDDWIRDGDKLDWAAAGDEPAGGSNYDITYEHLESVAPDASDDTTITVSGGVDNSSIIVAYTFKLPRVDRLTLDENGNFFYAMGISNRETPRPPQIPSNLLSLATIYNNWIDAPTVDNDGTRNVTFEQQWAVIRRQAELNDLIALDRLRYDIARREPTAKHRTFVDNLETDRYRDAGVEQDAAVFDGSCQIAIDPTLFGHSFNQPQTLDYESEIIINQDLKTGCMKINPYQVFSPPPITFTISPSQDFWEETSTTWLSPITRAFGRGNQSRILRSTVDQSLTTQEAAFLRQINISFEIGNLGEGEAVSILTFDGIDVNPGGIAGDANGDASGQFVIPPNITTGVKEVFVKTATSEIERDGRAQFEGRGVIRNVALRRVTDIQRFDPPVSSDEGWGDDPLAQTFTLDENRMLAGIDVEFCTIGDTSKPVLCEIVDVVNGVPTRTVLAQTVVDMATPLVGAWTHFGFAQPVFIPAGREFAFVFRTDDADHELAIATRGGFDQGRQEWLAAQPWTIGVLHSSSNASSWTAHQDTDLRMRVYAAVFEPQTKTIAVGTYPVVDMSDLIVAADVRLPTSEAQLRWKITTTEGSVLIENNQNLERDSFYTGDLIVEAVLTGSSKISPVLSREVLTIAGKMREEGTYVSRVFEMGTDVRQQVRVKTKIPTGASLKVELDANDNNWSECPLVETELLSDGTKDELYSIDPFTADPGGRLRLTLEGDPQSRPALYDLRSFSAVSAA